MTERVRRLVEDGIDQALHLGAQVHVSLHGETVASFAVGDVAVDSVAPWFSMTKLVSAVAFAVAWERHGLDLDDRVADYVPEAAAGGKDVLTLRHLLTHTAGLHGAAGHPDHVRAVSAAETLARVCAASLPPGWVPGRRAAYDGAAGYVLLGEVVHRVDGRPFDVFAHDEVLAPLEMSSSSLRLDGRKRAELEARLVVMHQLPPGYPEVRRRPDIVAADTTARLLPGSGGLGPMRELVRVVELLLGHGERAGVRLLSPQTAEAMVARHRAGLRDETFGHVIDWGLGVMVNSRHYTGQPYPYGYGSSASMRTFGHGGAESSLLFGDPEVGLAVAMFTDGMPGERANLARFDALAEAAYADLDLAPISR